MAPRVIARRIRAVAYWQRDAAHILVTASNWKSRLAPEGSEALLDGVRKPQPYLMTDRLLSHGIRLYDLLDFLLSRVTPGANLGGERT
jgi:hypothetical protein